MVTVKIPGPLRKLTSGKDLIELEGVATVKEAIDKLIATYPELEDRLKDENGSVREFINIFVNNQDIRFLNELDTPLRDNDHIILVPAIAGGEERRRITLYFPPERIKEPVIYNLGHMFKLVTNIRKANVDEDFGWVSLEVEGSDEEFNKAIEYLKDLGIRVEPVEGDILV
ncbi:MAG: MoaD/ThiS family protein [Deltaproteobacteria bacterium]|nr:MoaD/ThiS family protein [Deltaproteobacteria bacterium]